MSRNGYKAEKTHKQASENRNKIYIHLLQVGPKTRPELRKFFNKPRSTMYDDLSRLTEQGKLTKYREKSGKVGSPKVYWKAV